MRIVVALFICLASALHAQKFAPGCTLPYDSIKLKHTITDNSCPKRGKAKPGKKLSPVKIKEDLAKNDFCVATTPLDIDRQTFLDLGIKTKDTKESSLTQRG